MEFVKLGEIIIIKKGKKPSFSESPNEKSIRVLQIDDLRNDNNLKYTDDRTGTLVDEEDILLAWDGANAGTVGYGKIGSIGSTIAVLKKKNPKDYSTIFIGKFLQSQFEYLRSKATGATIPHIDRKSLDSLKLPIIGFSEQIRIAEILTQAENLIIQRKESIALLDELLKSTFLEMFGDPFINPKKLKIVTFEEIAAKEKNAIVDGPFGSSLKKEDYFEKGIPIIRINNIRDEGFFNQEYKYINEQKYNELIRSKIEYNDILIARVGNTIGKSCLFNHNFKALLSTTGVAKLTVNSELVHVKYIMGHLRLPQYRKYIWDQTEGGGQPYLNLKKIKNFKVLLPSLHSQNKFVKIFEQIEVLKIQSENSLKELNNMYGILSQKAFKGELNIK